MKNYTKILGLATRFSQLQVYGYVWLICFYYEVARERKSILNTGVSKTRIANTVSNSVNSGEQCQIVANSDEQNGRFTA